MTSDTPPWRMGRAHSHYVQDKICSQYLIPRSALPTPRRLLLRRPRPFRTLRWSIRITYYPERMSGTRRWKGLSERPTSSRVTYLGAAGRKLMRTDNYRTAESRVHRRVYADEERRGLQLSTRCRPSSAIAWRTVSRHCSLTPGRIRSTMLPTTPTLECAAGLIRLRSVVRPTTTSGTRSPAPFPITFRRRAAESGRRSRELVDGFDHLRSQLRRR